LQLANQDIRSPACFKFVKLAVFSPLEKLVEAMKASRNAAEDETPV
jgi:hypothetical protein